MRNAFWAALSCAAALLACGGSSGTTGTTGSGAASTSTTGSGAGIGSSRVSGAPNVNGLTFFTGSAPRVYITNGGAVGINVPTTGVTQILNVGGYIYSTAGGFVFPDGSVQAVASNPTNTPTFQTLTVTGAATIGGVLTVNSNINVIGNYLHNGQPFTTGITGISFWYGGVPQGYTEPGIDMSGGCTVTITMLHAPGSYGGYSIIGAQTSDGRVKENVRPLEGGLSVIGQLHLIEAEYNGLAGKRKGERVVGVIAQELEQILPDSIIRIRKRLRAGDIEDAEVLHVDTSGILFHMALAIQQLSARLDGMAI